MGADCGHCCSHRRAHTQKSKLSMLFQIRAHPYHIRRVHLSITIAFKAGTASAIFDLPIDHGGEAGLVITVELYGPTCVFLIELLSRCGYERIPEGTRQATEMDSIMFPAALLSVCREEALDFLWLVRQHACVMKLLLIFYMVCKVSTRGSRLRIQ